MPGLENIEVQPIQSIITSSNSGSKIKTSKPSGNVIQPNHARITRPSNEAHQTPADKYDFEEKMYNIDSGIDPTAAIKSDLLRVGDVDPNTLQKLFYNGKYFIVKSNNHQNVLISKKLSVWATPPANEKRFDHAFKNYPNVFLIFSVRESGLFQGVARIRAPADHTHPRVEWSLPPTIDPQVFSGIIKLDWISRINLPFTSCSDLRNSYNDNKEVKISRDGQEVEPVSGEKLCKLFLIEKSADIPKLLQEIGIDEIIAKSKSHKSSYTEDRGSPSKDMYLAKSRARQSKDFSKRSSYSTGQSKYNDEQKDSHKNASTTNLIPNSFFQKLCELSQLSYEDYVAAVSNNRKANVLNHIGFTNPPSIQPSSSKNGNTGP